MTYSDSHYEHYRRIRQDPVYRLEQRLLEIEAESKPTLYPYHQEPAETIVNQVILKENVKAEHILKLQAELYNLRDKVEKHITHKKKGYHSYENK